jgi:hypothetical protein
MAIIAMNGAKWEESNGGKWFLERESRKRKKGRIAA